MQVSAASQVPAAGRQTSVLARKASSGQVAEVPSQVSCPSQGPTRRGRSRRSPRPRRPGSRFSARASLGDVTNSDCRRGSSCRRQSTSRRDTHRTCPCTAPPRRIRRRDLQMVAGAAKPSAGQSRSCTLRSRRTIPLLPARQASAVDVTAIRFTVPVVVDSVVAIFFDSGRRVARHHPRPGSLRRSDDSRVAGIRRRAPRSRDSSVARIWAFAAGPSCTHRAAVAAPASDSGQDQENTRDQATAEYRLHSQDLLAIRGQRDSGAEPGARAPRAACHRVTNIRSRSISCQMIKTPDNDTRGHRHGENDYGRRSAGCCGPEAG